MTTKLFLVEGHIEIRQYGAGPDSEDHEIRLVEAEDEQRARILFENHLIAKTNHELLAAFCSVSDVRVHEVIR